jgi:hypothetical protein
LSIVGQIALYIIGEAEKNEMRPEQEIGRAIHYN